jgi:schlafen family protein
MSEPKHFTSCDAEASVRDRSYLTAPDQDLVAMRQACLTVGGPNQPAVARIHKVADTIQAELDSRSARQKEAQQTPGPAMLGTANSAQPMAGDDSPPRWTEDRILRIVADNLEESLGLEYKAAAALKRESKATLDITKDVSAMANSAGGVVIYGIGEVKATKQIQIDPVDGSQFSKEWLEQIVSQIRPRIDALRIHPVQLNPGKVVYVVEVPQGATAHQATDCKYYRRQNFEAVPMYDHEIRDVMNRTKHPRVRVSAKLVIYPRPTSENYYGAFVLTIGNDSDVLARYVSVTVDAPFRVRGHDVLYREAIVGNCGGLSSWQFSFSNHSGPPLFPRSSMSPYFQFKFVQAKKVPPDQISDFRLTAFADSMPMVKMRFREEDIIESKSPA